MSAAQCRGEAFAIIWHKYNHTQTSKCFAPTFYSNPLCFFNKYMHTSLALCDTRLFLFYTENIFLFPA